MVWSGLMNALRARNVPNKRSFTAANTALACIWSLIGTMYTNLLLKIHVSAESSISAARLHCDGKKVDVNTSAVGLLRSFTLASQGSVITAKDYVTALLRRKLYPSKSYINLNRNSKGRLFDYIIHVCLCSK